ncbi:MAG TPA: VOC family protein [Ilumatobacteraceae bacterium]|nr:VOC family protein [Ilumatobacteraceae bacterium]
MIRLRQVALVAHDLEAVVRQLCEQLGVSVCFRDPGVAAFGLDNALMMIGDQFLEVVSPTKEGTTAGRLLHKRGGDGGYMAIYEVDDLDERERHLGEHGVRIVWRGDFPAIRGRHLHPADVGGAIVSIDQPNPNGAWLWGGPSWVAHQETSVVTAIAGVSIGAVDPATMRARWTQLGLAHAVRFVPAGVRGEGLDALDLVATDRTRAGESFSLAGVTIRLV